MATVKDVLQNTGVVDTRTEVILTGDLNIDLSKKTSSSKKLISLRQSLGLRQLIKSPTRCTKNSSTLIDILFTNVVHVYGSGCLKLNISDHTAIYLVKKKIGVTNEWTSCKGRSYARLDEDKFKHDLLSKNLADVTRELDLNIAWNKYIKIITEVVDCHCLIISFNISATRPPYITPELEELSKDREDLLSVAKTTKNENDWKKAISARREANTFIRRARREYIMNQFSLAKGDNTKFWRAMNNITTNKNPRAE